VTPRREPKGRAALGFGPGRRVRKRHDFVRIQGDSRRVTTRHYVFLIAAQPSDAPVGTMPMTGAVRGLARLGLVVTKKVGVAVVRNRIKRVCRECFRLHPDLLPAGVDLVVIARAGAGELGLDEVRAEWAEVSGLLRRRAEEALRHARASASTGATGATGASGTSGARAPSGRNEG
jgi:ribonuclease P protein component